MQVQRAAAQASPRDGSGANRRRWRVVYLALDSAAGAAGADQA